MNDQHGCRIMSRGFSATTTNPPSVSWSDADISRTRRTCLGVMVGMSRVSWKLLIFFISMKWLFLYFLLLQPVSIQLLTFWFLFLSFLCFRSFSSKLTWWDENRIKNTHRLPVFWLDIIHFLLFIGLFLSSAQLSVCSHVFMLMGSLISPTMQCFLHP